MDAWFGAAYLQVAVRNWPHVDWAIAISACAQYVCSGGEAGDSAPRCLSPLRTAHDGQVPAPKPAPAP